MRRCFSLAGLGVLVGLAGCGGADERTGWTTRVDTPDGGDGAVRVVNEPPAGVAAADSAVTWRLEEDFRLGGPDVEGPASFGQIAQIAVDGDGRVAVLDFQAQELRVFGSDGAHLRTFGGKGGGPGELDLGFGVISDGDRFLVPENGNARLSVFHADSGFITSHRTRFHGYGIFGWDAVVDSAGRIVVPSSGLIPGGGQFVMRTYDRAMNPLDTLAYRAYPEESGTAYWRMPTRRGGWAPVGVPFHAQEHQVLDRTGALWLAETDPAYRLKRYIPGGDTLLVVEIRRPTRQVTAAERDSAIDAVRSNLRERGIDTEPDWSRIPDVHPAIHGLVLADDGDLWVRTSAPDERSTTYDVLDDQGRYRGTALVPGRVHPYIEPVVRGERVWAVVLDELDVMYLVAGRLVEEMVEERGP